MLLAKSIFIFLSDRSSSSLNYSSKNSKTDFLISWHFVFDRSTFYLGRFISLSASMVSHRFFIYWGTSSIATLLLITFWFSARWTSLSLSFAVSSTKSSGSSILEGKKNAYNLKRSLSSTCSFPGGFLILFQASYTLENILSWRATTFYLPAQKSLTTKIMFLGYYEPKSLKLSSRIISRIASWDPL